MPPKVNEVMSAQSASNSGAENGKEGPAGRSGQVNLNPLLEKVTDMESQRRVTALRLDPHTSSPVAKDLIVWPKRRRHQGDGSGSQVSSSSEAPGGNAFAAVRQQKMVGAESSAARGSETQRAPGHSAPPKPLDPIEVFGTPKDPQDSSGGEDSRKLGQA